MQYECFKPQYATLLKHDLITLHVNSTSGVQVHGKK